LSVAVFEQLSLFSSLSCSEKPNSSVTAVSCMDGRETQTVRLEAWMTELVPNGEYAIDIGAPLPMVLRPVEGTMQSVPQGHEFYHYMIGRKLYAGIFVGRRTA
jgi:hypothetical protein